MPRKKSEDEEQKLRHLQKEICELRSSKKELFERAKPINDELKRIAQRERECVDELHRLTAEKREREQYRQTVQRLVELESEMKRLKCENEALRRETAACTDMNNKLRWSLDRGVTYSRVQRQKIVELHKELSAKWELGRAKVRSLSETADNSTLGELQKQLSETHKLRNKIKQELSETRHRLCEVQERLTVAEQVTAATQQRAVLESDNSQELLLQLNLRHHPATSTGSASESIISINWRSLTLYNRGLQHIWVK